MHTIKCLAAFWIPIAATAAGAEQVVVPLTHPGQPVTLDVGLTSGSISAEAYEGAEVIVEVSPRKTKDQAEDSEARSDGMRRLPSTGMGFSVEEKENLVAISSQSWKHTLDVTLRVPAQTSLRLRTVNHGHIKVRGTRGDHELSNVNGPIEALEVAGSVIANTTNGDLRVTMTEVAAGKPMAFSTLNGNVDVTLPTNVQADLRMRSDNGDVLTDFDVVLTASEPRVEREADGGRFRFSMKNETRGQINGGGPEMSFRTHNGDVLLRKGR